MKTVDDKNIHMRISVRNFVEFLLRTGDIDNRRGNINSADAMLMGSRIHRKIQKSMAGNYRAEVTLKLCKEEEGFVFVLEGRADGILADEDGILIDEIKGVFQELSELKEPYLIHEAQAKCYAYIYARQNDLSTIRVQITYCHLETEDILRFTREYTFEELSEWFDELYKEYQKWMKFRFEQRSIRQESIKKLEFPFPYRKGQAQLVKDVYRSILREKTLFVQAPTGVGKTISTIFPAVKAVGEDLCEQIFYLTAKTITRTAANDASKLLMDKGLKGRVLTITAKDKICPLEERSCNPEDCPYAKGYYDRINDAVFHFLQQDGIYDRNRIVEYALKEELCPFEFGLDVSLWCDIIIGDYNYVFDPNVYLKRFFAEGVKGDYVFLVDEAHNMIERTRKMYSAALYKDDLLTMKRLMMPYSKRVTNALNRCNKLMLEYKRDCDTYQILESFSPFLYAAMSLMGEIERFNKEHPEFDGGEFFSEFYLKLRHFINMSSIMDEKYCVYTQHDEQNQFMIKLYCIDPSNVLQEKINMARSCIYFSATLLPITYYRSMLSAREDTYAVYAETSFRKEQSVILVASDVSSKYTRRNQTEYRKISDYIRKAIAVKKGNYMVFFPSYRFMQDVYACLTEDENRDESIQYILQSPSMTEEKREEFLAAFHQDCKKAVVGLCVMGGVFSEGIDLTNDRLIGAIIVGTGLPQISNEKEVLKTYFEEEGKNGFDYSFRFPGMNKVQQAAGRVIRTMEDRGIILLLDERFLFRDYYELYPREWEGYEKTSLDMVEAQLRAFWEKT